MEVSWEMDKEYTYSVKLRVQGEDKKGLLNDITSVLSASKANIINANVTTYPDRSAISIFEIEILNAPQVQKITKSIMKLKGVKSVERLRTA